MSAPWPPLGGCAGCGQVPAGCWVCAPGEVIRIPADLFDALMADDEPEVVPELRALVERIKAEDVPRAAESPRPAPTTLGTPPEALRTGTEGAHGASSDLPTPTEERNPPMSPGPAHYRKNAETDRWEWVETKPPILPTPTER